MQGKQSNLYAFFKQCLDDGDSRSTFEGEPESERDGVSKRRSTCFYYMHVSHDRGI